MAVIFDRIASGATVPSNAYIAAGLPQPLHRDRSTLRVPPRAIGAGIEAASIGARTGTSLRRLDVPGLDLDLTADYACANRCAGVQDLLTHEVAARHVSGVRSLRQLAKAVEDSLATGILDHPESGRALAFLAKIRPGEDVLTLPVELFGHEATVTAPITAGSAEIWATGFDLVAAAIEDLARGGTGKIPHVVEAWTFAVGSRMRGLRPVTFPGGWIWDPRREASYRSRDGRTWGHLPLLLAAMREFAKHDPELTAPMRIRRRGMLKVASLGSSSGLYAASTTLDRKPGSPHRVITSEGILRVSTGTPERPGPWAFPPGAALVQGAGRLLLALLLREIRARGGMVVQIDTDGVFVVATLNGGWIVVDGIRLSALSFAEVQQIRQRFVPLARWSGLPITPDRLNGRRLIFGEGAPSLLKYATPMVGPDGELGDFRCYTTSQRRFWIHD